MDWTLKHYTYLRMKKITGGMRALLEVPVYTRQKGCLRV